MRKFSSVTTVSLAVALLLWDVSAFGQQPEPTAELDGAVEQPWARGVPVGRQRAARQLLLEGNELLTQFVLVKATEKYMEALSHWDHPAIHYNLALALTNLNRPVELYQHLEASVRHGEAPLGAMKYQFALSQMDALRQKLAWVEITCDKPGAKVTMDGQLLFMGPGRHEGVVPAGQHSLMATLEGHEPNDQSQEIKGGESTKINFKLYTTEELTRYHPRWPEWLPWAIMGTGVAVAAGGGVLHQQARDNFLAFDAGIASECSGTCTPVKPNNQLANRLNLGNTQQYVAIGSYVAGGMGIITGAVLLYLNRDQSYRITPEQLEQDRRGRQDRRRMDGVSIEPFVGGGVGGAQATFRF